LNQSIKRAADDEP
jgi:Raf kinase inhibitor-like YbhB/YbcL family protein